MTKTAVAVMAVFVALVACGCAHMPAGIAPSATPIDPANAVSMGHATGASSYFSLLMIFPLGRPNYDAAIAAAVATVPGGRTLINVRAWSTSTYAVVGYIHTLHVEGDVVK